MICLAGSCPMTRSRPAFIADTALTPQCLLPLASLLPGALRQKYARLIVALRIAFGESGSTWIGKGQLTYPVDRLIESAMHCMCMLSTHVWDSIIQQIV